MFLIIIVVFIRLYVVFCVISQTRLRANVFYFGIRNREYITSLINKDFNLGLDLRTAYIKLRVGNENFIIANLFPNVKREPSYQCREMQAYYYSLYFNDSEYKEWWAYQIFLEIYRKS